MKMRTGRFNPPGSRIHEPYKMDHFVKWISLLLVSFCSVTGWAISPKADYVSFKKEKGCFTLARDGRPVSLVASKEEYPGVLRIMSYLQTDIERVTGKKPDIIMDDLPESDRIVLIGTLGKNPLIDRLVKEKQISVAELKGKWESTLIQVINRPMKGVEQALVIIGSDKRGTIYGLFDVSDQIGVSPWVWWADVPVKHQPDLYVLPGRYTLGEPAVKYRGIFLNDEEPALGRWAVEKYGGFNSIFYEKVFELILRLKGNYLWPAMWWAAFNSNDSENPRLADEMGIVMGTSHHEPMMRAQAEWRPYGGKEWNYETNEKQLQQFWTEGIRRMGDFESIVTMAMRGDGDLAMSENTNIALLERIVSDQRKILSDVTGKDVTTIPQIWALYKEVQDYYDKGMVVPEDITLMLCDDNWGNVRRLPKLDDRPRTGGYGMYYHFDFVGGPRNYKWVNTNPIARVWEQMHLCYEYGVRRIWLVNVGDLKPMEFPISFFLDYAWNPDAWPAEQLPEYSRKWAEQQFGLKHASEIADIITLYLRYNSRRKPEMLSPETYNLLHYQEAENIVSEYNRLAARAETLYQSMPEEYRNAFYQLVLHPVIACANLNELLVTVAKNRLYARQGRISANDLAEKANTLFEKDAEISRYYNTVLSAGKWNHMMDQTHIGYTSWQQPEKNIMPSVDKITPLHGAEMAVAVEGSESWWPMEKSEPELPAVDPYLKQSRYMDIYNRGDKIFSYSISCDIPWLLITPQQGIVEKEQRVWIHVDWKNAQPGSHRIPIWVTGSDGKPITVHAVIQNSSSTDRKEVCGFVESDGYISMEAEHCSRAVHSLRTGWLRIPDFGRTLSGMTPVPVTALPQCPGSDSTRLEYRMILATAGEVEVSTYLSPTQNFHNTKGLFYGISFDDAPPQLINIHINDTIPDWKYPQSWNEAVGNNIKILVSKHVIQTPGEHILKYWMADPGIVLQKIVVNTGGLKPSYLGPPESFCWPDSKKQPFKTGDYHEEQRQ